MIIKERVYQECKCCGSRKMVSDEEYGCDNCGKPIDMFNGDNHLGATVHWRDKDAEGLHFCSWRCTFSKLSTVNTDYFISWPLVSFDESHPDRDAAAFWQAVREFGQTRA